MKTGYVRRLGPGPDPVRPQGPVHQAAGPGPYLHGAGPTISGPDPRTSLWGPVRSEVRKGQDRTADSLFEQAHCSNNRVKSHILFPNTSGTNVDALSVTIQHGSKTSSRLPRLQIVSTQAPVRDEMEFI